eukprot:CAMPEP_0168353868 /NCGR_PEP_ID=MMETSP0213-20121227/23514_1 /TAXON_ID=151035 /ORGANISM="Euplotes harpa, Strain FSP1.4" /LENGTH=216 /DNA_ID=CAMNT_0008365575 /DNA_START=181 /DNA_END=828 /DNA_ORIENTATION=+
MAQADPAFVRSQVRHGDAAQVRADGRAHQDRRVLRSGRGQERLRLFIENLCWSRCFGLLDFSRSQSSDEDQLSVPGGLQDLTRWQLLDVEFFVRVSDVSDSRDHLIIHDGRDGLGSESIERNDEPMEHVHLRSLELVILALFVPQSVLVEPVVGLGLCVQVVSEVAGSGGGQPKSRLFHNEEVVCEFLVLPLVVLLHEAKLSEGRSLHSLAHLSQD